MAVLCVVPVDDGEHSASAVMTLLEAENRATIKQRIAQFPKFNVGDAIEVNVRTRIVWPRVSCHETIILISLIPVLSWCGLL